MQVKAANDVSILSIKSFLGLNENPDGDTTLKPGEMSVLRNFRITQDRHLQIRPGCKTILSLKNSAEIVGASTAGQRLFGLWRGTVGGRKHTVAAYAGHIWDVDIALSQIRDLGTAEQSETFFFGFDAKLYFLNGFEYKCWDGKDTTQFETVEGYVPIVQTASTPGGAGTKLEEINRLTEKRRVQFSPDGTATAYILPEQGLSAVNEVKINGTATTAYTADLNTGTVTMASAPAAGTNTIEITYSKHHGLRAGVLAMRYAELYNGAQDTRVFLYGDGQNVTIYSGIPYGTGQPSAEYFPDLFEIAVGERNSQITALVRHYSRLMAFKPDSAYVIQYNGTMSLSDGSATPYFYVQPVNRQFGNEAEGQVQLLENNPLTLDAGSIYQWRSSGYSTYITANENNAQRISDRVQQTLRSVDISRIMTYNVKRDHEYWFMLGGGRALILNYANDCWYTYESLPFERIVEVESERYGFCSDGSIVHFSRNYRSDDGEEIHCRAETGAMDFSRDWQLKYSPLIFVAMQPESGARVDVTVATNRRSEYPVKTVAYGLSTFSRADFRHWSFGTNRRPQVKRVKIKVKKATFYRLVFQSDSTSATATIIETDIKLRYAGNVK